MEDNGKPKAHELVNISFYPPSGAPKVWKEARNLATSPNMIAFHTKEGLEVGICGNGVYLIEQIVKTPESTVIYTPPTKPILAVRSSDN